VADPASDPARDARRAADPDRAAAGVAGPAAGGGVGGGPADGDVVRARPVRLRRVATGAAVVVVVLFAVISVLPGHTSSEGVVFGPADQVAMMLLGLLVAGGVLLLARPTVVADLHGVRVRNIVTTKDVPWEVVRAVSFPDGTPWAILDLADDDQIAMLAVQSADGRRAVATVRALRALHTRHAAGEGRGSSGRSDGVT